MGSPQSTRAMSNATDLSGETTSGASGRKSTQDNLIIDEMTMVSTPSISPEKEIGEDDAFGVISLSDDSEDDSESEDETEEEYDSDEEDEEEDEGYLERFRILADCRNLKTLATAFLRPEEPVVAAGVDPASFGRNYFNRASAPETEEDEDADERAEILAEAMALKESAVAYMHPEVGVKTTDGAAFGRNYFNRASAPETEDEEDAEERAAVLAEAMALKESAVAYMHPEVGVKKTDGAAFGRNYFERPNAPAHEEVITSSEANVGEEFFIAQHCAVTQETPEHGYAMDDTDMVKEDMEIFADLRESIKSASIPVPPTSKAGKLAFADGGMDMPRSASNVMLFGLTDDVE